MTIEINGEGFFIFYCIHNHRNFFNKSNLPRFNSFIPQPHIGPNVVTLVEVNDYISLSCNECGYTELYKADIILKTKFIKVEKL